MAEPGTMLRRWRVATPQKSCHFTAKSASESCNQSHSHDERGRNLAEPASPPKRGRLRMIRREGALIEAIEDESVSKGDVQVILDRAMEIQLRPGLIAKRQTSRLELVDIPRPFVRITGLQPGWHLARFQQPQRTNTNLEDGKRQSCRDRVHYQDKRAPLAFTPTSNLLVIGATDSLLRLILTRWRNMPVFLLPDEFITPGSAILESGRYSTNSAGRDYRDGRHLLANFSKSQWDILFKDDEYKPLCEGPLAAH